MDEITLFDELQPPPLPDAPQMREAVRARLTVATSTPPASLARRRRTMVAVTAAAAVAAAGTGYGLAAQGSSGPVRGGPAPQAKLAAGLTAVHGCPGEYVAAGTLERVSGTRLVLQPVGVRDQHGKPPVATVATSSSTAITRPARGTVSDITDGSRVLVQGAWSGGKLVATKVGIEAALPSPLPARSFPRAKRHVPPGGIRPPFANGTVADAHGGSFTVIMHSLLGIPGERIQVVTSSATEIWTRVSASVRQLSIGADVVAVGPLGSHGVMRASTVAEPSITAIAIPGGPTKIPPSSCSASAITTAILAGG